MSIINIGIVKSIISKKMSIDYLNEGKFTSSKNLAHNFLKTVENNPLLQLEFKVFDRLENRHISDDFSATRYIDTNLNLFEGYSKEDIDNAHQELKPFFDNEQINESKVKLFNAISSLIYESVDKKYPNVDILHDSFITVLNHLKEEKEIKLEELISIPKEINGDKLVETALNKFTKKYESLEKDDFNFIKKLIEATEEEKKNLFESFKNENLSKLNKMDKNGIEDKINETINKINKMEFSGENSIKNIIDLRELNKDLIV